MNSLPFSQLNKPEVPPLDYEVAELTWENGQVAMHGFGLPRLKMKPVSSNNQTKYTWEKPRASGTLESVVNQAAYVPPHCKEPFGGGAGNEDLVPWFGQHWSGSASATMTMDALVPCSKRSESPAPPLMDTSLVGCSIDRVGSCSVAGTKEGSVILPLKRARVARVHSPQDWSSRNLSIGASATFEKESQYISCDTYDGDSGVAFTSTSPENTSSGKPTKSTSFDDHDSVCHSKPQRDASEGDDKEKGNGKSSVSNKRSRVAAIHNQSERKRRYKINQKMKTLQKLVPSSSKTDKASMLDEVIEYLKQLQTQVQMMRMNMPPMMLPPPMQQLQMSMLQARMGLGPMIGPMGMGLGMGIDMNSMSQSNISGVPPVLHPADFMFVNPWDGSANRLQPTSAPLIPDPVSSFLSCQSQPINMDAYCRLAAMYQQIHQQTMSSSKN